MLSLFFSNKHIGLFILQRSKPPEQQVIDQSYSIESLAACKSQLAERIHRKTIRDQLVVSAAVWCSTPVNWLNIPIDNMSRINRIKFLGISWTTSAWSKNEHPNLWWSLTTPQLLSCPKCQNLKVSVTPLLSMLLLVEPWLAPGSHFQVWPMRTMSLWQKWRGASGSLGRTMRWHGWCEDCGLASRSLGLGDMRMTKKVGFWNGYLTVAVCFCWSYIIW